MGEWRNFLVAVSYFTRIPVKIKGTIRESDLNNASRYFPLIGIIVGTIAALVFHFTSLVFPLSLAIILSMISTILLTGAFHEDGLSDFLDGFGGGYSKEKILLIMKDSRIGSFGAIGLALALLLKFSALSSISPSLLPAVMVAGHSLSRFITITFTYTHKYARENEDSKAKPMAKAMSSQGLVLAGIFGILPLFLLPGLFKFTILLAALFLIKFFLGSYFNKKIGGYTGDCLGAAQQILELSFYLGAILIL